MGVPIKALQNFFDFQRQKCKIENFKLKILICCNSLIINLETLFIKHPISSPFFYGIEQFFLCWKCQVKGYKCSLSFKSRGIMCKDSISFVFQSVHSQAYLPYYNLLEIIIVINSHLQIQVCFIKIIEHVNSYPRIHKVCHYPLQLNLDIDMVVGAPSCKTPTHGLGSVNWLIM